MRLSKIEYGMILLSDDTKSLDNICLDLNTLYRESEIKELYKKLHLAYHRIEDFMVNGVLNE